MDTPQTLALALAKAGVSAVLQTRGVVQKGALNVKKDWKANVLKSAPIHNAGAAQFITYETKIGATTIEAEIGYDKTFRPARLGNILEYGSEKNPPHRDGGRALDAEEPRFEQALGIMAAKLLD